MSSKSPLSTFNRSKNLTAYMSWWSELFSTSIWSIWGINVLIVRTVKGFFDIICFFRSMCLYYIYIFINFNRAAYSPFLRKIFCGTSCTANQISLNFFSHRFTNLDSTLIFKLIFSLSIKIIFIIIFYCFLFIVLISVPISHIYIYQFL